MNLTTNTAAIYTTYTENNTTQWWIALHETEGTETNRLDIIDGASLAEAQAAANADLAQDGYQVTSWRGSYACVKFLDDIDEQHKLVDATRIH